MLKWYRTLIYQSMWKMRLTIPKHLHYDWLRIKISLHSKYKLLCWLHWCWINGVRVAVVCIPFLKDTKENYKVTSGTFHKFAEFTLGTIFWNITIPVLLVHLQNTTLINWLWKKEYSYFFSLSNANSNMGLWTVLLYRFLYLSTIYNYSATRWLFLQTQLWDQPLIWNNNLK
jgi:hypothetical protein